MRGKQIRMFVFLGICGVGGVAGLVPAARADAVSAEAAVRKADAAWSAAASTGNVDAWMAFLSADAIVHLPYGHLTSGVDPVRRAVVQLLGSGHADLQWHALSAEAVAAGDAVEVVGEFQYLHDAPSGATVTDRGSRVEIWRHQADGTWKCALDRWTIEARDAVTVAPPPTPAASAAAVPAATIPAAAAPRAAVPAPVTKYGDPPVNYQQTIRQYFQEHLIDPQSIQYQEVTNPEQGSLSGISSGFLMHEVKNFGWIVKATINARNGHGSYVGFKTYQFLFRGEQLVRATAPPPAGEMVN